MIVTVAFPSTPCFSFLRTAQGTCYMGKFERDVLQGNGNVEHYSGSALNVFLEQQVFCKYVIPSCSSTQEISFKEISSTLEQMDLENTAFARQW
mmetsp:Transcript_11502/g.39635  ORF Transcript_11502/g.39635 Transcript_11502/m.39635 type:complete len:94 (+) Transcript_11502:270-551(+)